MIDSRIFTGVDWAAIAGERNAVEIDQILGKRARLGDDRAVGRHGEAGSVEDQAVVPSYLVDHDDRNLVPGGNGGQHAVTQFPLTPVVRRG